MKKIKVFYGEKRLKDIYPHATRWQVCKYRVRRFFIKLFKLSLIVLLLACVALASRNWNPKVIEIVKVEEVKYPVLDRIAKCESGGKQFTNGQVTVNGNKNGSVDIGKYQINVRLWGKKATELGYNLATEEGNEGFAMYLYKTQGTSPWIWSQKCWQ